MRHLIFLVYSNILVSFFLCFHYLFIYYYYFDDFEGFFVCIQCFKADSYISTAAGFPWSSKLTISNLVAWLSVISFHAVYCLLVVIKNSFPWLETSQSETSQRVRWGTYQIALFNLLLDQLAKPTFRSRHAHHIDLLMCGVTRAWANDVILDQYCSLSIL